MDFHLTFFFLPFKKTIFFRVTPPHDAVMMVMMMMMMMIGKKPTVPKGRGKKEREGITGMKGRGGEGAETCICTERWIIP